MMKEFWLVAALAVCGLLILLLLLAIFSYKRQMKNLSDQLDFIRREDTNQGLTTQVPYGDVNRLAARVNSLLQKHRRMELDLQRMNRQFQESITSISHDLRTPLTSMSGYLQMLSQDSLPPEKRREYLRVVEGRLSSLEQKLGQLFLYARIAGDELPLESAEVNLSNLLRDCISEYYSELCGAFGEPALSIPERPCRVLGDPEALMRILENLIRNVLAHGTGDFRCALYREERNAHLLFSNRTDSVDPQDLAHLFDRFYTSDQSRTKKTTGLGLSIARSLTEKQGGTIRAELSGEHLQIHVWLPLCGETGHKGEKTMESEQKK